jgi:hypothetical protein
MRMASKIGQLPNRRTRTLLTKSIQLLLRASALVFIAGCGGGSGDGSKSGGGNPTTVSFSFSNGTPTVVAAKIGSGSFTVQALAGNKLSLSIPSGTSNFAVAFVCTAAAASLPTFQEVFEASVADGSSFTLPCLSPLSSGTNGTLTGNVDASAIPNANLLNIAVEDGSPEFNGGIIADTNFSLNAPAGNDRVEVLAYKNAAQGETSTTTLVAARNFADQTVPGALNGGKQVVLGAGDATTNQMIAYSNIPSGYSAPSTLIRFNMGGHGDFSIATAASTQYPVLPAGAVASGDFYEFSSTATNSAKPSEVVIVTKFLTSPGAVSLAFPSPWSYAGPSPAALPSFNFSYSGFSGDDAVFDTALFGWATSSSFNQYLVIASSNYLGGSTTVTFPDLSNLEGFIAQPPSGTGVSWVSQITQSSLGVSQPMSSNATIMAVGNDGSYTVP